MARASKKSSAVKVNFKNVESRKTPPEGDYLLDVIEAKNTQSGNGNDQIEFVLEIANGEYKGTKLWFYCPLADNSLWKLHAFLTALGEDVPQDEMEIDLPDLVGKQIVGVLTHETYQGKKRAKMTDFESVDDYQGEADLGKGGKKKKKEDKDKSSKKDDKGKDDKKSSKKDEEKSSSKKDDKKDKGKKKPKTYSTEDVEALDEDELEELNKELKLGVKLKGLKLKKAHKAVVDALEEKDLLKD